MIYMAQYQGHGWLKVKKYIFMSDAERDLAVLQTFHIIYLLEI
jgi:hypothetical protein